MKRGVSSVFSLMSRTRTIRFSPRCDFGSPSRSARNRRRRRPRGFERAPRVGAESTRSGPRTRIDSSVGRTYAVSTFFKTFKTRRASRGVGVDDDARRRGFRGAPASRRRRRRRRRVARLGPPRRRGVQEERVRAAQVAQPQRFGGGQATQKLLRRLERVRTEEGDSLFCCPRASSAASEPARALEARERTSKTRRTIF